MRYSRFSLLLLFISFFTCETVDKSKVSNGILPLPLEQTIHKGKFLLNNNTYINAPEAFKTPALFLENYINIGSTIKLGSGNNKTVINFKTVNDDSVKPEGYILEIATDSINIQAKTAQGAFYAVQSLRQLLPESFENGSYTKNSINISNQIIKDSPQFSYRGMHLDVGRHMFSVEFIKKYVDMLSALKLNTFHWHLTEDQGWRIEIDAYPKLNQIASYRKETLIGHYNDQPHKFDNKPYGGFYTKEEIREVVTYAKKRFVTVIPEIEMPGHAQAVIAAYPELGCTGKQVETATKWGVFEHIYCSKEETFTFLENVLDEVLELFPSQYIHIGGDEAPKTNWKACPTCQKRIKNQNLKDEHGLQSYFINRIETYLNSKGRNIIGWDEILEGGLAPNATVMSWRGTKGGVEAAKAKHNVIMTPTSNLYFDYYQSENETEPLAFGGFLPLEKVYSYNPIPEELTEDQAKYILGAQGNVWTEYIPNSKKVEYMAFPRMIALSEVVWSAEKNYPHFIERLEHFNKRLDALTINYANHLYEIEGELQKTDNGLQYTLNTLTKDKTINYTTNNSAPNAFSEIYKKPIIIDTTTTIKAAVFSNGEQLGSEFSKTINIHKAVGKSITLNVEPHKAYNAGGKVALINGMNGSNTRFGDKEWLGFWGDDLEITIDLGEVMEINSIKTRFFNANGQWIYSPKRVKFSFDNSITERYVSVNDSDNLIAKCSIIPENTWAKTITLIIPNYGTIPDRLQGAGNKAWTFIDEIIIN